MPKRKRKHKAQKMQEQRERARLAMREMKVRLCLEYKMTVPEMSRHTGLSEKNIKKILNVTPDLAALHTFSLIERTDIDDKRIENLKRFL